MNDLISEVARFRRWAAAYTPDWGPEWECDYENWHDLYDVVLRFVKERPFASWTDAEINALLYALARDNELQHIPKNILSCNVVTLIAVTRAAVEIGEPDAKWQLAEELGHLEQACAEAERLLVKLARDDDEYVRRKSLEALARLHSPALEELALAAWQQPHEDQDLSRMMVLWCLHRTGSPHLETLLVEAEQDERPFLSDYAKKIRRGEVES